MPDNRHSWARVTEILRAVGISPDYSGIDPVILEVARQRGVAVDLACDLIDGDDLDPSSIDPRIEPYVDAYRMFSRESGYTPEASQQRIFHPGYKYRGTLDMRGQIPGGRLLADRKCVATMDDSYSLQVAAYRLGHEHEYPNLPVDMIAGLHLRRDGTYRLIIYEPEEAQNTWLACVTVYNEPDSLDAVVARKVIDEWKRRHGR